MDPLTQKLTELHADVKKYALDHAELQKQINAIDLKMQERGLRDYSGGGDYAGGAKAIVDEFTKHIDDFKLSGRVRFEIPASSLLGKSQLLSTSLYSAEPARGVDAAGRFPFMLRRLLTTLPTNSGSVFALAETAFTDGSGPQSPEGGAKGESTWTFEGRNVDVATLAHYVNASRQIIDDVPGMTKFLDSSLIWGLERRIEAGLLYGNGFGLNLLGMTLGATAFDTTLLPSSGTGSWDRAVPLAGAAAQMRNSGYSPTHYTLNPLDWYRVETAKDTTGRYLIGDPKTVLPPALWGLQVILSSEQAEGSFTMFDASRLILRERLGIIVDVSDSHNVNFTTNMLTFRCEWRGALVVQQSGAVIVGALDSSPA